MSSNTIKHENATADAQERVEELIEAARKYWKLGVIPLPLRNGKKPLFKEWQKTTEFDEQLFRREFRIGIRKGYDIGVGVRMGPESGIIDCEYDTPAQRDKIIELFDGELPCGPQFISKHGEHWLYKFDSRLHAIGKSVLTIPCADGTNLQIKIGVGPNPGTQSAFPPSTGKEWKPRLSLDDCAPPAIPEATIARMLSYAKPTSKPSATSKNGQAKAAALSAMLRIKPRENENDGSNRLYRCALRCVEYGLSDADAISAIRQYEGKHPFPRAYTDAEIINRLRDAEKKTERGSAIVIANFEAVEIEDEDGEKKTVNLPLSMSDIIDTIYQRMGDWPRRVDNMLFVDDPEHGLDYFDRRTTPGLFGWLRRHCKVTWVKGNSHVKEAELFAEIERTARRYDAIELLPHEPPIDGIYYRGQAPMPGDGTHLRKLLDRFRPETTIDRDLIQAAFMTPAWGGLPGCRPAFVVTSDDGRGVGKSKVAEAVGHLYGGHFDVSAGEDIEQLKTRMLTPSARTKRIALLDNVKTLRLSWAELEAMITSPIISGRQNYVGEGQRPNLLTWFITLNGVSMATDMAQRSVIIKVVRGKNDGPWWEETRQFIDQYRDKIIGDIIGALRADPFPLAEFTRWATWEQHVLTRLPEPGEAQRLILERQGEADCELDEIGIIEEFFAAELAKLGYDPNTAQVRIPTAVAARWYCWATNEPTRTTAASKRLHQMAGEGHAKRIAPDPSRSYGRGFIWTGPAADVVGQPIANDLPDRIARLMDSRDSKDA